MIGYTGWRIPEGNVVQVAKDGIVLWQLLSATNEPTVVLDIAKKTLDTYDGGTTYEGEEFVLLDIYPKKGGTVTVTYGGLTKTITDTSGAEEPNAQKVFFGTFNGVSDTTPTPSSGRLTIEGAYRGFGAGTWSNAKSLITQCACITGCIDIGNPVYIGRYTFYNCESLTLTTLPEGLTYIGNYAFYGCTNLALTSLPNGITEIGDDAFFNCSSLTLTSLPNALTRIGQFAFKGTNIRNITVPESVTYLGLRCLQCHVTNETTGYHDTNIKMLGTVPPTMVNTESSAYADSGAFGRNEFFDGTITVPRGYGEAYKNAEVWSNYANKIVEG